MTLALPLGIGAGLALSLGPEEGAGGASGVEMPAGAIGIWYADEFQSSPRKAIPNAVSEVPLSANLLRAPVRLFNNGEFWVKNGTTVTESEDYARVQGAAGDSFIFFYANGHPSLPAGTYTLALMARRHGATDQQFRMSFLHAGVDSAPLTAGADWAAFSLTATVSAGTNALIVARTIDNSTAFDIDIKDVALYEGSSNLGEPALAGHLYIGDHQFDTKPGCSGGELDLTADGAYGLIQFADALPLSEFTVLAVGSKTIEARAYSAIIGNPVDQSLFAAMMDKQKSAASYIGGGSELFVSYALTPGGLNPYLDGYRFVGVRYDGSRSSLFLNDTRLIDRAQTGHSLPASVSQFLVGAFSSITLTGNYKFNSIALYDRALTDSEMQQAYAALKARAEESSLSFNAGGRYLIAVGDSITAAEDSYAHQYAAVASPRVFGAVYANVGGTLDVLASNADEVNGALPPSPNGATYILTVCIGTNDLTASTTAAQLLTGIEAYADQARAAGWLVGVATLPPNNRSGFNAKRAEFNTGVRALVGTHIDACIDFAAHPEMGPDGAEADTSLYSDGVHPTVLGQTKLMAVYKAAVDAMGPSG